MKKLLVLLLSLVIALMSLSGCSKSNDKYQRVNICYAPYTTSELVEKADEIFEGTVTNIYFIVMDGDGNIAPGPYHKGSGNVNTNTLELCTVYEVTTNTVFKGSDGDKKYIKNYGGIPGYREEDQLETLKQSGISKEYQKIAKVYGAKILKIGVSYLFVGVDSPYHEYLNAINVEQFAFNIAPGTTDPEPTIDEADRYPGETIADDPTYQKIIDYFK